jgi:hypothetical protein
MSASTARQIGAAYAADGKARQELVAALSPYFPSAVVEAALRAYEENR